jgi:hypothetical protein
MLIYVQRAIKSITWVPRRAMPSSKPNYVTRKAGDSPPASALLEKEGGGQKRVSRIRGDKYADDGSDDQPCYEDEIRVPGAL